MTRINSKGDNRKPCLIPLEARKKSEGVPFTKTEKLEEVMHPMIQFTPMTGKPICNKMSLRKVQFTWSNALTRSSLRTKNFFFLA